MSVNLSAPDPSQLFAIAGVRMGVAQAGIRKVGRDDLTVMLLDSGVSVAGVLTQNRCCAAPVLVCREHLSVRGGTGQGGIRALLINTGCANACTGDDGYARAQETCQALAGRLGMGIAPQQVLPFSTGVIMEALPVDKVVAGLDTALADARPDHWLKAARAIMTTDTVPKAFGAQVLIDGAVVSITGISKGAGMIHPNMATMLGFLATDACVSPGVMQQLVTELAEGSFNRVTVDGDTSTNDSFVLMVSHRAAHAPVTSLDSAAGQSLRAALLGVAQKLAQAIVRDGEGASKFITLKVEGGKTSAECLQVGFAIAHSPLVKTAFFASDPNLGRILAAVGYAGVTDMDQTLIDLYLDDVQVAGQGARYPAYRESDGQRVMQQSEITVRVVLGRGLASETVWTCDLSHDYVSINADYRS